MKSATMNKHRRFRKLSAAGIPRMLKISWLDKGWNEWRTVKERKAIYDSGVTHN